MTKAAGFSISVLTAVIALGCAATGAADSRGAPSPDTLLVRDVVPRGGTTNVNPAAAIVVHFNHAMMTGMETRIALHEGSVTGPVVAGAAVWSADRTSITFTPASQLKSKMTYVLHLSPNLIDVHGDTINFAGCANPLGGQSFPPGMMGGWNGMMGGNTGMMGSGWEPSGGTWGYGMTLTFTTA